MRWLACPNCGEPRSARCPICGESSTHFLSADAPPGSDNHLLLLCPSCDDCIIPEWYRLCARCGHDFGDGLEIKEPDRVRLELPIRVLIVLILLLGLTAIGAAYFRWLFMR